MDDSRINILLRTFGGLGLPSTLCIPVPLTSSISDVSRIIHSRLPDIGSRYIISTSSGRFISADSLTPIVSLTNYASDFLSIRLAVPILGGKGGFGSQLRAAGGRMSSKRKRNQGENRGSSRNLDGRRLRTVNEAKALAEYLAVKPDMDRKEKETRRKRWEQIVDMADQKEHEIKRGNKGKVDGEWIENKDEANERTRQAVKAAMIAGSYTDRKFVDGKASSSGSSPVRNREDSSEKTTPPSAKIVPRETSHFFGFDDDDEFMSEESGDSEEPVS